MATDKLWSKKCSSSSSVADRRTGDGVRRQLEYALAPFNGRRPGRASSSHYGAAEADPAPASRN